MGESKVTEVSLYRELPGSTLTGCKDLNIKSKKDLKGEYLYTFLQQHVPESRIRRDNMEEELKYKSYFLDTQDNKRKKYNMKPAKRKILTAAERKKLKLFKIEPQQQKYEAYVPMHDLWKQYMRDLINFPKVKPENKKDMEGKLLKADYHGGIVTVTRSKCPSLVGATGIILMETKHTFKIITKENRIKTIPKQNTVFTLHLDGYVFNIYGNHFQITASNRTQKKFKFKPTIDL